MSNRFAALGSAWPWLWPWMPYARSLAAAGVLLGAADVAVGTTPKELIWRHRGARFARYARQTVPQRRTPVLLVGPLFIRRAYLFDLRPGASFVEFLLGRGFDVFVFDWEHTDVEDASLALDTVVARYLRSAVLKASLAAGEMLVTLLGISVGGTLAACLNARFPDDPVKNLVLLNTPIDFSEPGYPGVCFARELFPLDQLTMALPAVPTQLPMPNLPQFDGNCLATAFNPAPRTLLDTVAALLQLASYLDDPAFDVQLWQAVYRWLNEAVPFPAAAFRQWVEDFYRKNRLVQGTLQLAGRTVRLGAIRCPLLNVAAASDTVAPRPSTSAILPLAGSEDKTELVLPGGHVGVVVGCAAPTQLWPKVADWLARHD